MPLLSHLAAGDLISASLKNNLYKLWNRLSSGSYFPPPVKRVEIPKANGKLRPLGIPTIADRIAQARQRCWRDDWVLDMDIRGFFDALDHNWVMKAVAKYTGCRWTLLYTERWLKADVVLPSGERLSREKGTPQGGVISPLLANIFLHLVFDQWMQRHFPCIHFERYADDIVVHCRSESQLKMIAHQIRRRFTQCGLELCEEKTKIVYCKDSNRRGSYPNQSFDFLGVHLQTQKRSR